MAKIGLDNFRYGILTEAQDGTPTYGVAAKPGKAISCSVSVSNNSAKLYADNVLAESDTSFQSGTVTLGLDEDDIATQAALLGHTVEGGVIIRNSNDAAPYVGIGRIVTKMVNGAYKYKVEFLNKVKFAEPSQEDNTKGESVEFGTVTIEGTVAALNNGDWSKAQTFDTYSAAVTYLESLFASSPVVYTVTYNVNGGTGSIDAVEVTPGESITLDDGSGLTAPSEKVFAGWAKTATATAPTVSSPYTPLDDTTLYAVWVDAA